MNQFSFPSAFSLLTCSFFLAAGSLSASADNLIPFGDFEKGIVGWTTFVPGESKDKNCTVAASAEKPHGGAGSLAMSSDSPARFGAYCGSITPKPDTHYRVQAWVRCDVPALQPGAAGALVRVNFMTAANQDSASGHLYVGLNKWAQVSVVPAGFTVAAMPTDWTLIEAVFQAPSDTTTMGVTLLCAYAGGKVYWDDVVVEEVGSDVPLTPLTSAPSH